MFCPWTLNAFASLGQSWSFHWVRFWSGQLVRVWKSIMSLLSGLVQTAESCIRWCIWEILRLNIELLINAWRLQFLAVLTFILWMWKLISWIMIDCSFELKTDFRTPVLPSRLFFLTVFVVPPSAPSDFVQDVFVLEECCICCSQLICSSIRSMYLLM